MGLFKRSTKEGLGRLGRVRMASTQAGSRESAKRLGESEDNFSVLAFVGSLPASAGKSPGVGSDLENWCT